MIIEGKMASEEELKELYLLVIKEIEKVDSQIAEIKVKLATNEISNSEYNKRYLDLIEQRGNLRGQLHRINDMLREYTVPPKGGRERENPPDTRGAVRGEDIRYTPLGERIGSGRAVPKKMEQPKKEEPVTRDALGRPLYTGPALPKESESRGRRTEEAKEAAKVAGAAAAAGVAEVLKRPTAVGAIGVFIFLIVTGPVIWLYFFTNVQLPYSTQIRTTANTLYTQIATSAGFFWCALNHLDLVFAVTTAGTSPLNQVCGRLQPIETFEEVVSFRATVPATTSLDIPIVATMVAELKKDDRVVDGIKIVPRVLDSSGIREGILILPKEGCPEDKLDPKNASLCYREKDSGGKNIPECHDSACRLDITQALKEINYVWSFANAEAFDQKYFASSDTTRLFPKFDVEYTFRTDTPSKTILVTTNERTVAPGVSGSRDGPVNVELEFSRDVFVNDLFPEGEKIQTFVRVIVKNNGVGKARNIDLIITPIFDSELGEIEVTECAGVELEKKNYKTGESFELSNLKNVVVFDKRSVTTGCFIKLPRPTDETNSIIFAPTIKYTYEHKGPLAIEPTPPTVTVFDADLAT